MESAEGLNLLIIGAMLLAGLVAHFTGPRAHMPKVTILLVAGAVFGPSALDIIPGRVSDWFPLVTHMALAMIGFLLGESFVGDKIKSQGKAVAWVTVCESLAAALLVFAVLWAVGAPTVLALVLAGIAPASAPAAIFETIREGNAKGPLTETVLGVVAIDDALGIIIFSLTLTIAGAIGGEGAPLGELAKGGWEVLGAILLGAAAGFPMAWISGKVRGGEMTLVEAAGFVFLAAGLASMIHVSYILASMVMGVVVANFSNDQSRPFHVLEKVREPFLAIFFILAGMELNIGRISEIGLIGAAYVVARVAGLVMGGRLGGIVGGAPEQVKKRVGFCILPQAGVALGFALLVREKFPDIGDTVLSLVIASTVIFAVAGPAMAKRQLEKAGEMGPEKTQKGREKGEENDRDD